jgi:hypothetical protein
MPFTLYKDYEIQSVIIPLASGQWQVEVRVFSYEGCQVGVQFLPMPHDFATAAEALQAGMVYGRQQVDALGTPAAPQVPKREPRGLHRQPPLQWLHRQ